MERVHLDTDIGGDVDDLCALALLLRWPGVEITGITTNTENGGKRAGYAEYALTVAGVTHIPVKAGVDVSGGFYRGNPGLPEESDYWPEPIPPRPTPIGEALDLLKNSIEQNAIIIGIGAFTNLFFLDQRYPGILERARLYLMGGYVYPIRDGYPKWDNEMDWNIQADVRSAKYVLGNSNPTLIPLSVSVETALRRAYLPALRQSGELGRIIATQAEAQNREYDNEGKFGKTCDRLPRDILNFQHDPLACAVALGWDGVEIDEIPLALETRDGWLHEIINPKGKKTKIVTKVDGDSFNALWLKIVTDSPTR